VQGIFPNVHGGVTFGPFLLEVGLALHPGRRRLGDRLHAILR